MTLLVGKEKVKFNLHQSIQLTDEEKMACMRIESSFLHFEEQTPRILQETTLIGVYVSMFGRYAIRNENSLTAQVYACQVIYCTQGTDIDPQEKP